MSISLLIETQSEVRRLLIAGSGLAVEDFRLKKLLPQMKKAGESVPVFARVADAIEKVVDPDHDQISEKLLELGNIVNAILYTQGQTGIEGELHQIDSTGLNFPTDISYRRLKPVIESLTRSGSGRLETIREAYQEGLFGDLRLVNPLISALGDNYPEISELVSHILEGYGAAIVPVVKSDFNFQGGKGHARRVDLISKILGGKEKEFYLEVMEKGSPEVKASAVKALKDLPECEALLLELSKDKKKEIREASLLSLAYLGSEAAVKRLFEVFNSKERSIAVYPVKVSNAQGISRMLLDEGERLLEIILKSEKGFSLFGKKAELPADEIIENFATVLDCMEGKKDEELFDFLTKCLPHAKHLQKFKVTKARSFGGENTITRKIAQNIMAIETREAFELLDSIQGKFDNCLIAFSFEAAVKIKDQTYVFDHYAKYVKNSRKSYEGQEILEVMDRLVDFAPEYRLPDMYDLRPVSQRMERVNRERIPWDHRWLKMLIDIDEMGLVCRLASNSDTRCIKYLLKKLEMNKNFDQDGLKDIIRGLLQAEYAKTMEVILHVLEENFQKTGQYLGYYFNDFVRVLRFLPPENAEVLERFALNCQNKDAPKLFEAAQYLKSKQQ